MQQIGVLPGHPVDFCKSDHARRMRVLGAAAHAALLLGNSIHAPLNQCFSIFESVRHCVRACWAELLGGNSRICLKMVANHYCLPLYLLLCALATVRGGSTVLEIFFALIAQCGTPFLSLCDIIIHLAYAIQVKMVKVN